MGVWTVAEDLLSELHEVELIAHDMVVANKLVGYGEKQKWY